MVSGTTVGNDSDPSETVEAIVTLSRSGGFRPAIHHAPQMGVRVTVTDSEDGSWSGITHADGVARLSVPSPSQYEVEITGCPNPPQEAALATGATVKIRFDCIAP